MRSVLNWRRNGPRGVSVAGELFHLLTRFPPRMGARWVVFKEPAPVEKARTLIAVRIL